MRHDGGGRAGGAGEDLFALGAGLGGHASVAEGLVAEGEQGVERGLFQSGSPVVGPAAGLVKVEPRMIGRGPASAEDDVAAGEIQQVAGAEFGGAGEHGADSGELRGVVDGGEPEAA